MEQRNARWRRTSVVTRVDVVTDFAAWTASGEICLLLFCGVRTKYHLYPSTKNACDGQTVLRFYRKWSFCIPKGGNSAVVAGESPSCWRWYRLPFKSLYFCSTSQVDQHVSCQVIRYRNPCIDSLYAAIFYVGAKDIYNNNFTMGVIGYVMASIAAVLH